VLRSGQDGEKGRLADPRHVHPFVTQAPQTLLRLLDAAATKLGLDGPQPPSGYPHDDVDLKTGVVAVVVGLTATGAGVRAHVADHHRLEDEAEELGVPGQPVRTDTQGCTSQRRIGKVDLGRGPQPRP